MRSEAWVVDDSAASREEEKKSDVFLKKSCAGPLLIGGPAERRPAFVHFVVFEYVGHLSFIVLSSLFFTLFLAIQLI